MKKISILLALLLLAICVTGCNAGKARTDTTPAPQPTEAPAPEPEPAPQPTEAPAPEPEPAPQPTEAPASEPEPEPQPTDAPAPEPDVCTYTVYARDVDEKAVAGVMINFCTDESCRAVTTDADGVAVFTGAPAQYHVQVVRIPDGRQVIGSDGKEFYTEPHSQEFRILFSAKQE